MQNGDGTGGAGADGREVILSKSATHVQWKYEGDAVWQNLVALSEITGVQGPQGVQGVPGAAGAQGPQGQVGAQGAQGVAGPSGREVEISNNGSHIQWRYAGATEWANIVALSALQGLQGVQGLKGDTGAQGPQGLQGAQGLQGPKGDTGAQGVQGIQGTQGAQGVAGNNGWAPVLAVVSDGERRVHQVVDWTGGQGTKPPVGQFIGTTGLVATAALAVDIRGAQGPAGTGGTGGGGDLLSTGKAGGQTFTGGTGAGEAARIRSTSSPSKGPVFIGDNDELRVEGGKIYGNGLEIGTPLHQIPSRFEYFTHFLDADNWQFFTIGGNRPSSVANGVVFGGGMAANTTYGIARNNAQNTTKLGIASHVFAGAIRFITLATAANDCYGYLCCSDANDYPSAGNMIGLGYHRELSGDFFVAVTKSGYIDTRTISTVPVVANQYYKLLIEVNKAGTQIRFYVDNILIATHTTNINLATIYRQQLMFRNTAGTTVLREVEMDWYYHFFDNNGQ